MYVVLFCNYSEEMDDEVKLVQLVGYYPQQQLALDIVHSNLNNYADLEVQWEVETSPNYWRTVTYAGIGFYVVARA